MKWKISEEEINDAIRDAKEKLRSDPDTIQNATTIRSTTNSSKNLPTISDVQSIKNCVFRISADNPALRTAVQNQINQIKIKYPSYKFSARFGGS